MRTVSGEIMGLEFSLMGSHLLDTINFWFSDFRDDLTLIIGIILKIKYLTMRLFYQQS